MGRGQGKDNAKAAMSRQMCAVSLQFLLMKDEVEVDAFLLSREEHE